MVCIASSAHFTPALELAIEHAGDVSASMEPAAIVMCAVAIACCLLLLSYTYKHANTRKRTQTNANTHT
jgi:hypothetical protein